MKLHNLLDPGNFQCQSKQHVKHETMVCPEGGLQHHQVTKVYGVHPPESRSEAVRIND